MGPLPKRKKSSSRARQRLSHTAVTPPKTVLCPQCHSVKLPHHACPSCGTYNGREVVKIESSKKPSA